MMQSVCSSTVSVRLPPPFFSSFPFPPSQMRQWISHRHGIEVAEVATLRTPVSPELLRVPLHDAKRVLKHGIRPVNPTFLQFISFPPSRMRQWISHRHGIEVAEVATLRAPESPELLRVPLRDTKRVLVHGIRPVNLAFLQFLPSSPSRMRLWDQSPPRDRSSRSGNTSGTRSFGTLASSATRCKACARARYPSGQPHLSSVHLLSPVSNVAMAVTATGKM